MMHKLATNAEQASNISPPDLTKEKKRRIGSKSPWWQLKDWDRWGEANIPTHIWDNMSPANFRWATHGIPPPPPTLFSRSPLVALTRTVMDHRLVALLAS